MTAHRTTLALAGRGQLHDALAERLRRDWDVGTDGSAAVLTITASDTADLDHPLWTVPWLPVHGELDRVVMGPLVRPGIPGCPRCLERRRAAAFEDPELRVQLDALPRTRSPLLTPLVADAVAALVAVEVATWAATGNARTVGAALMLDLGTLAVQAHRLLPDPACVACGGLPDDAPSTIVPAARPKAPGSFRTRELVEADLLATYVDPEAGLIPHLRPRADLILPTVSAQRGATGTGEEGHGRTLDFRSARLTSVAEALERLGGVRPGGRRTVVRDSYRMLKDTAVDPTTLGLYPEDRCATEGFRFQPYHDDLELAWVWAYSFGRGEPVLVPESYAYYRMHAPFVYEISNGCALGNSVEEAVLHGLLEIAERDAFLMTWYARMPIPELDPASATDHRIGLVLERIRHRTGYPVRLFTSTLEQRVPCFWAMAVDGSGDPDRPAALCAAGSALDPERGVLNALQELAVTVEFRLATYPAQRERAAAMVSDPDLVRVMDDHSLLYCHPDAATRLDFLLAQGNPRPFGDFRETWHWPEHDDLRDDLTELLGRFLGHGLDVVVVDQTTPEHRAGGFTCVKVIVPGTLPMTFGHQARRVDGLPRLFEVPHRLGYRPRPLTPADVNPYPHPFP
jgi:ribosomal protein S12 methylthiotransferase accessory factor